MLRDFPRIIVLAVLLAILPTTRAGAQDSASDRVQTALETTDRRIEQAQFVVSNADNERAQAELDLAVDIQGRARSAFVAIQLELALRLTLEARGHADRAIAIVKGLPDPDRVLAQLERTRELLERARERVEECDNDRARAMIRTAFEMQLRAETAARDGRFLAALQLTMSARERGLKALRLCNLDENLHDAAERALQRTDEVVLRAQDVVTAGSSEVARRALARAIDLQQNARAQFREGRFEACLRLTHLARASAFRAIRLAEGKS
jgi:hypothetical protein